MPEKTRRNKIPADDGEKEAPQRNSASKKKPSNLDQAIVPRRRGDDRSAFEDEEANSKRPSRQIRERKGSPPTDDLDDDREPTSDEPRFRYSTADLDNSSCRNSRCCLITAAVLCIIVAIVLSIVMAHVTNKKDEENTESGATVTPTASPASSASPASPVGSQPGVDMFKLPRETVEGSLCPLGQETSDDCINTCEDFDCCDPTLQNSCFLWNPDGCFNYKRCHATSSGIEIPPSDLADICTPAAVAADRGACETACAPTACCWESDVTCYDKIYTCLDYSPCQNLRADSRVPAATIEVEKSCDTAVTGSVTQRSACEEACEPAECCWDSGDDGCLETDFLSCLTYNPCKKLYFPIIATTVRLPPATIPEDCSVSLINSGSTEKCKTSCSAGTCCFDAEGSCFNQDPLACLAYETCRVLADGD